jgi:hypothetical protein
MIVAISAPSFFKQELARFTNDQSFVYYKHVVAGVMQFDDRRVLHFRAEPLDYPFSPHGERVDVVVEFVELY